MPAPAAKTTMPFSRSAEACREGADVVLAVADDEDGLAGAVAGLEDARLPGPARRRCRSRRASALSRCWRAAMSCDHRRESVVSGERRIERAGEEHEPEAAAALRLDQALSSSCATPRRVGSTSVACMLCETSSTMTRSMPCALAAQLAVAPLRPRRRDDDEHGGRRAGAASRGQNGAACQRDACGPGEARRARAASARARRQRTSHRQHDDEQQAR